MTRKSTLLKAPPYAVEQSLKRLGVNLRTARLRRSLTLEDVAQKIGVQGRTVSDAEKGHPSTSAAVYLALLWAYGLVDQIKKVADPSEDKEGEALALSREGKRARRKGELDNEF